MALSLLPGFIPPTDGDSRPGFSRVASRDAAWGARQLESAAEKGFAAELRSPVAPVPVPAFAAPAPRGGPPRSRSRPASWRPGRGVRGVRRVPAAARRVVRTSKRYPITRCGPRCPRRRTPGSPALFLSSGGIYRFQARRAKKTRPRGPKWPRRAAGRLR